MKQYLLSVIEPSGEDPPPPHVLHEIGRGLAAIEKELRAEGSWVFAGGLHGPAAATTVRVREGELQMTDGPYIEAKEHIGGFTVLKAEDLDSALRWAERYAAVIGLPVEVRPFREG
ncbi:MAG: hypothetical protein JWQ20_3581 [Conexibacter sp.]|nr:hypothetical protein [Conexibacter sp.]